MARILALAGSTRSGSFNKKLVRIAASGARNAGAEVTEIDLRDFPMPIYDGDLEAREGVPEHARRLKRLLIEHQGLLLACPEYNSSITGVLKNAIDWASRPEREDEPDLVCFKGKTAALLSASPGGLGGLRGLYHVREILANIYVQVIPELVTVRGVQEGKTFTADGKLSDPKLQKQAEDQGKRLAEAIAARC
jgi:NAD(P)H-dependent FMN reductase